MPFDPKLIRPDDPPLMPNGELDLPSDLKALAEQLGEDAAHLAACYPPRQEIALPAAAVAGRRRATFVAAGGAAVLVTALVGAAGVWLAAGGSRDARAKKMDIATMPSDAAATNPRDSISAVSTVSLADLSAPEMEALLDLIEREPNQGNGIAF